MAKKITVLFFLILLNNFSFAQQGKGQISGVVRDLKTNKIISNVLVRITQTKQSTYTNENGEFKFGNLEPGSYTIHFFHKEYSSVKIPNQEVFANSTIFLPVTMVVSSGEGEGTDDAFFIGGMEVTAPRSILPEKVVTATEISSGEIEHLQATNLGDVMQMIPGVVQQNQGLRKSSEVILRGVGAVQSGTSNGPLDDKSEQSTKFGTKIMVDGSTLSNNANMNNTTFGSYVSSNDGGGIDLRSIAADNIESVEVLQGVTSAKYGDFTEGVVIVKTKSGYQAPRLKIKSNPDTKEMNLNGGLNLNDDMTLNYNFNFANTDKNLRRDGDDYQRIAGQLKFGNKFFEDKSLEMTNGFYYTRLFDDYKNLLDPVSGTQYYNHGYTMIYNNETIYKIDNLSKLEFHASLNYTKQDKFDQDITRSADAGNRYITGFMTEGTFAVGKSYGAYIYQTTEKGNLWTISFDGGWSQKAVRIGSIVNNLSAGFNYQYDDNTGEGLNFDPTRPPYGSKRPFSYDAVPATYILSVYAEDEMHGILWKPYTFNAGIRYEMFTPEGINFKGLLFNTDFVKSRSGSFLEPRLSFKYFLTPDTRIRLGYGKNAKAPSLKDIFPQPSYFDIRQYYGDKRDTISDPNYPVLFNCYIFDRTNRNLRAYEESKYEYSLDQRITDDIGLTIRGYFSNRYNEINTSAADVDFNDYYFVPIQNHPNWPNPGGETIRGYTTVDVPLYKNKRYSNFNGIDFILTTKKIESISSSFYISGSYDFVEYGEKGGDYKQGVPVLWSTLDSLQKVYHNGNNIVPVFYSHDNLISWYQKIMMNYKWDFTIRKLGLWFTLWAQQIISVKTNEISRSYQAIGYMSEVNNGALNKYSDDVPSAAKLNWTILGYYNQPIVDTWTFNINISKSLYRGAEASFFVNNFLDRLNNIFYGLELSVDVQRIFE